MRCTQSIGALRRGGRGGSRYQTAKPRFGLVNDRTGRNAIQRPGTTLWDTPSLRAATWWLLRKGNQSIVYSR